MARASLDIGRCLGPGVFDTSRLQAGVALVRKRVWAPLGIAASFGGNMHRQRITLRLRHAPKGWGLQATLYLFLDSDCIDGTA